jgi:hypothetical protein
MRFLALPSAAFAAAVSVACLHAGPALAQRAPGPDRPSDFEPGGKKAGAKDTRRVVQEFARCLVRRSSAQVADYLDRNAVSLSGALRSRAPECLMNSYDYADSAMLKGSGSSFRYAFAEALLVRQFGERGIGDLTGVAPLVVAEVSPGQNPGLQALAECIIRRDPSGSWGLLRTDAASAEEKAHFERLAPTMKLCVARGTTLKMQAFFMRGAIAETYYLLSKAPRAAPGATS